MKTQVLLLAMAFGLSAMAANQVPNGDFELWQTGSFYLPSGFSYSSNSDRFYRAALPYNVEQTTDAHEGMYAVRLTTGQPFLKGDSPNFGYLLNYPPDGGTTQGLPLTETPTGLRGYYKYAPVEGDSGIIMVGLFKQGVKLADYNYVIKGEQSTYIRFEIPFNKTLNDVPDLIQIGFASSFSTTMRGNVGTTLYLDSVGLMGVSVQPQALAGNFETWTLMEHHLPLAWTISGNAKNNQSRTEQSMNGSFALELQSFLRNDGGNQKAEHRMASLGYRIEGEGDYLDKMHLSGSEDTLSFFYSYRPGVPGYCGQVNVLLFNGDNMVNNSTTPLIPAPTYAPMLVPLHLHDMFSQPADSIVIEFVSGMWEDSIPEAATSVLRVDAVTLLDYKEEPVNPTDPIERITETTLFPNGGFEDWDESSFDYPTSYFFNSNQLIIHDGGDVMTAQKTTDAKHGIYALKLINQISGTDFDFGFVMNTNGNDGDPSTWLGGCPIEERPSGISGFYKYNEATRDSGTIIVGFNKNGQVLQTYTLTVGGLKTEYTPFSFTFDPPLTEDPDSMVLAFASTKFLDGGAWPGCELIVDSVSMDGMVNQPVGMNGDFEDWQTETLALPSHWYMNRWLEGGNIRTSDASAGNYAICLTSIQQEDEMNGGIMAIPGLLTNGYWDEQTEKQRGGVAFSNTKDTLVFMYKYIPANSDDRGYVALSFMREGQPIWNTSMSLLPSNTYKKAQLPINLYQYTRLQQPDTVIVSFRSSQWYGEDSSYVGSRLWVDDVHFASEFFLPPPFDPNAPNAPVPNGGFEQWKALVYDTPVNYPFTSHNSMQPWLGVEPFVFKTTNAHGGEYALKLVTRAIGQDVISGFVSNYDVNEGELYDWHGGMPIAEKPTGIKGYYTYNMGTEDTALIVAAFSKAGVNVGYYIIKLDGPKASYTPFEYTFEPPLTETPDSMILAITSSNAVYEYAYAGSELYLDELELTGVTNQPLLMNGNFEDWTSETMEMPLNWAAMGTNESLVKSEESQEGQSALSLRTSWNEADLTIIPGVAISSALPIMYNVTEAGFPVTQLKDTLAFYYRFTPTVSSDTAVVSVYMSVSQMGYMDYPIMAPAKLEESIPYMKGGSTSRGDLAWDNNLFLAPNTEYQYMEIPFDLTQRDVIPDRIVIMVRSTINEGDNPAYAGGELLIDNFHFKSTSRPVKVEVIKATSNLGLSPNPTRGMTRLIDPQGMYERIDVFNTLGQRVKTYMKDRSDILFDMDLTGQPAGLYLIKVSIANKQETLKLMLK